MTSFSQQLSHEGPAWAHLVSSQNRKTGGEGEHRAAGVSECRVVRVAGIRLGCPSFAVGITEVSWGGCNLIHYYAARLEWLWLVATELEHTNKSLSYSLECPRAV